MDIEMVQIQLPATLVQQVQQEVSSEEALSQVVAEAVQMWLDKRWREKANKDRVSLTLRQAGVIMAPEKQRALAEAMMAALALKEPPTRAQVEASLARLKVPLSEEIIAMRGER